ncbi:type II toxin-antitoxin system PemK/MazF family toxin, partial [Micromonospora sp. STR1_7]|nr:type II toxin-antitoxin system PemK/MazF family toxin [Micromonospora parastrephiae]
MPEALLWAVAVLLAVATGWAWNSWRHRVTSQRAAPAGPGRPRRVPAA